VTRLSINIFTLLTYTVRAARKIGLRNPPVQPSAKLKKISPKLLQAQKKSEGRGWELFRIVRKINRAVSVPIHTRATHTVVLRVELGCFQLHYPGVSFVILRPGEWLIAQRHRLRPVSDRHRQMSLISQWRQRAASWRHFAAGNSPSISSSLPWQPMPVVLETPTTSRWKNVGRFLWQRAEITAICRHGNRRTSLWNHPSVVSIQPPGKWHGYRPNRN